jgi:3,4-dihydroxy-2-butanone 4-phosphate synthase
MLQERLHVRTLDIPARDTLVAAAIRQMARDLRVHEESRRPAAAAVLDRTAPVLRHRLGRTPTTAELARAGGIDVEDVLDELSRRRRDPRASRA